MLNNIAGKLYSNKQLGTIARSVTIEDIEIGMNESGIESIYSYENNFRRWQKSKYCISDITIALA